MSLLTPKPNLASLPPELQRLIVQHIHTSMGPLYAEDQNATTVLSLSRTCRSLREVTLPLLWTNVEVWSVKALGLLRQLLGVSPSIAALILNFNFKWQLCGDYLERCDPYPQKEGALLDLAFRDRVKMWEKYRKLYNAQTEYEDQGEDGALVYFEHDGKWWEAPGEAREVSGGEDDDFPEYDYGARRVGGNGPDGTGKDKFIKTSKQFDKAINEVVAKMRFVEAFGWNTPVTPLPKEAFNSLVNCTSLTSLDVELSTYRTNLHDLPFWKIGKKLESLSISFGIATELASDEQVEEQVETTFTALKVPIQPLPTTKEAREKVHLAIATRTIIAAAKGGKLKHINDDPRIQYPFAIRSLLSHWLKVEKWGSGYDGAKYATAWRGAAVSLRPLLAHASLWQNSGSNSAVNSRLLTREAIQGLQANFKDTGTPKICCFDGPQPVERYLPWLSEDAELAQQVVDAWNSIVQSGQADLVKCPCDKCENES